MNDSTLIPEERLYPGAISRYWRDKLAHYSLYAAFPALVLSNVNDARAEGIATQKLSEPGRSSPAIKAWWSLAGRKNLRRTQTAKALTPSAGADDCPGKGIPGGTYTTASPYADNGDTTGANNSVDYAYCYFCGYYGVGTQGPDQVYSFRILKTGPNPQVEVVPSNPTGYKPLAYATAEFPGFSGCPANLNAYDSFDIDNTRVPGSDGIARIDACRWNCGSRGGRTFVYVDSQVNDPVGAGAYTLKLKDVTIGPGIFGISTFDIDGDGKSDPAVFRSSDSTWYSNGSSQGFTAAQFGLSSDVLAPADFDGDGKTDLAIFRDGTWWWINSGNSTASALQFGLHYAIPLPGDYTGDGRDDIAVYQNDTWWWLDLSNGQVSAVTPFDTYWTVPVVGDFDGDGRMDQAVFNPYYWDGGTNSRPLWQINRSSLGPMYVSWGLSDDRPVPGDYDGDGKTDIAVFRPSTATWYLLRSTAGPSIFPFGLATDSLAPADYDGDGKTDPTVVRDGLWYQLRSTGGIAYVRWGLPDDLPIQSVFPD